MAALATSATGACHKGCCEGGGRIGRRDTDRWTLDKAEGVIARTLTVASADAPEGARLHHNRTAVCFWERRAQDYGGLPSGVLVTTQVDNQDLVFLQIHCPSQLALQADSVDILQSAVEDRILPWFAVCLHQLMDTAKAFGIPNVVADQVASSHLLPPYLVVKNASVGTSPMSQAAINRA